MAASKKATTGTTTTASSSVSTSVGVDRVAMPSLRKDGTPDQTEDFEIVGDKDAVRTALVEREKQRLVSIADQELRGIEAASGVLASDAEPGEGPGGTKQDPSIVKLEKAHEKAEKEAEASAEAEIKAHFEE